MSDTHAGGANLAPLASSIALSATIDGAADRAAGSEGRGSSPPPSPRAGLRFFIGLDRRLIVPLSVLAAIFFFCFIRQTDYDWWWHLRVGQDIWQHRALPDRRYLFLHARRAAIRRPRMALRVADLSWLSRIQLSRPGRDHGADRPQRPISSTTCSCARSASGAPWRAYSSPGRCSSRS